jgi:hypothetical protein
VDLIPVVALMLAQALWFTVPYTWTWATNTRLETHGVGWLFVWAILGHSIQYLWITTYYAVGRKQGRRRWGYLFATLCAGSAIWTVPALLFSPQLFGTHPYTMGLFLMIAAAVNLHHFILDGAIWKLRDSGVGAILLAQPAAPEDVARAPARQPTWLRPTGWVAGALLTVLSVYGAVEQIRWSRAAQASDFAAARQSGKRLALIGRDDPRFRILDAQAASDAGDSQGSFDAYRASVAFYPTAEAFVGLALGHELRGEPEQVVEALQLSLSIDGDYARAHRLLGLKLLQGGRDAQGLWHLERAAQLLPADDTLRAELAAARSVAKQRKAP